MESIVMELCISNSRGSEFHTPSVKETRVCTPAEAEELLSLKMVNGYFWREQPKYDPFPE